MGEPVLVDGAYAQDTRHVVNTRNATTYVLEANVVFTASSVYQTFGCKLFVVLMFLVPGFIRLIFFILFVVVAAGTGQQILNSEYYVVFETLDAKGISVYNLVGTAGTSVFASCFNKGDQSFDRTQRGVAQGSVGGTSVILKIHMFVNYFELFVNGMLCYELVVEESDPRANACLLAL